MTERERTKVKCRREGREGVGERVSIPGRTGSSRGCMGSSILKGYRVFHIWKLCPAAQFLFWHGLKLVLLCFGFSLKEGGFPCFTIVCLATVVTWSHSLNCQWVMEGGFRFKSATAESGAMEVSKSLERTQKTSNKKDCSKTDLFTKNNMNLKKKKRIVNNLLCIVCDI